MKGSFFMRKNNKRIFTGLIASALCAVTMAGTFSASASTEDMIAKSVEFEQVICLNRTAQLSKARRTITAQYDLDTGRIINSDSTYYVIDESKIRNIIKPDRSKLNKTYKIVTSDDTEIIIVIVIGPVPLPIPDPRGPVIRYTNEDSGKLLKQNGSFATLKDYVSVTAELQGKTASRVGLSLR